MRYYSNTQACHCDGCVDRSLKVCPSQHFVALLLLRKFLVSVKVLWVVTGDHPEGPEALQAKVVLGNTNVSSPTAFTWGEMLGKAWGHETGSSIGEKEVLRCKKNFFFKLSSQDFISLDWTSWVCSKLKKKKKGGVEFLEIHTWNTWLCFKLHNEKITKSSTRAVRLYVLSKTKYFA